MAWQKIAGGREIIFRHGLCRGAEHSSPEAGLDLATIVLQIALMRAAFLAGCRMARRFTEVMVNPAGIL